MQEADSAYPTPSLGRCWAVGQTRDTARGMGKHNLRFRTAGAGSGIPRPGVGPGPSGSQTLGHLGAVGSLGRAENGVGANRLELILREKGGAPDGPCSGGWL